MNKIDKSIIGYKVKLSKPSSINEFTERSEVLHGYTYKFKPTEHAYYITINNIVIDGKEHPFEVFINSKDMANFEHISAITRLISAIFRKGGDINFVIEELQAICNPVGGYWGKDREGTSKKKFYNSFYNEIGSILAEHFNLINLRNGVT
jgi:hypothetical protein